MNRRKFLEQLRNSSPDQSMPSESRKEASIDPELKNPFSNKSLPETARSSVGLEPYTGPFGNIEAKHLLKRTMFGPKPLEIAKASQMGLQATIETLFDDSMPLPEPPLKYTNNNNDNDYVAIGESWVDADYTQGVNGYRSNSLRAWWIGLMVNQGMNIRERMTLFWYNHFVVENVVVKDGRFFYRYLQMLRENALGNFQTLVEQVTVHPAMLRYLNGNQNTRNRPNENFGRELFELFTIGKGPIIGEGDYTNYTEEDIREASKVLTGWRDRGYYQPIDEYQAQYRTNQHDKTTKKFSSAFQNREIYNRDNLEYKDLIAMIFEQTETARFICRKLYRWFIYYVIDEAAEANVIEPMAQALIANNYEVKPVLKQLLSSAHFFDSINQGCYIKNPIEFGVSAARQLKLQYPAPENVESLYRFWLDVARNGSEQQMDIVNPPNVAGWGAYYQEPAFYEAWVNSVTLPSRQKYVDSIIRGYRRAGIRMEPDPLSMVEELSDPRDPNVLISEWAEMLFPQPISDDQHSFLKSILLPGLPDYEWELEYDEYLTNPDDVPTRDAIIAKLKAVLRTMLSMAEFHLA